MALAYLRGRDADGRMQSLVAERAALRPVLGLLALRLVKRRAYEEVAFRCLGDYARERLGVTVHALREWARVWEALAELPQMRAAVLSGEVSWSVARRAVAHASPETDEAFAEALRGRTVCAAEAMLHAAFGPGAPGEAGAAGRAADVGGEESRAERVRVCVPLPAAQQGRWLAALELARRMAGETLPVWECAESMAAEALGAIPPGLVARAAGAGESASHAGARPASTEPRVVERASREQSREHGFGSFERYALERVDVSPRTARRWVRMERLGPAASAVGGAFRDGLLTPKQACLVSEVVPPAQQPDAIAFAQGVTLRRLEDELGARDTGRDAISFTAPPEAANVFLVALEAVRLHLEAEKQTKQSATEALLWMLDHVIAAWLEQGAQFHDYADFNRDLFRCTVPGCTARRSLQSHHIVFQSAGGPDEPWNRTTLCAFHHLRGIHAGTLRCSGRAPEGLVFELGLRAAGSPLLRARAGDVLLSA